MAIIHMIKPSYQCDLPDFFKNQEHPVIELSLFIESVIFGFISESF
ncbi:MAG: hypothetical protein ABF687_06530 [Lentilactobacillus diolivorans]